MRDIPFEAAKQFCKEYHKDQCIILSWDKQTGQTWVTTFGVGDENSIQAANAGKVLKDHLKLKRDNEEIPTRFEEWEIYTVEAWWETEGRNGRLYKEITYWFEKHSRIRKETVRQFSIAHDGYLDTLPDWAKGITSRRRNHNDDKTW
jgi:hypothetical protein